MLWLVAVWVVEPRLDAQAGPDGGSEQAVFLTEVTAEAGIHFVHDPGATGELRLPEITGAGLALLDVDGDGDLDIYFVQGGTLLAPGGRQLLPAGAREAADRLYRNDSRDGALRFMDITAQAGSTSSEYGMGAAAGDFDNDGRVDLYVTNLGPNRLLHNTGGKFEDVTESAGVGDPSWAVSATFVDLDQDGWLDLYVGNYGQWSAENSVRCYAPSSRPDYCGPLAYPPQADVFYRNRGDGTFEVAYQTALRQAPGAALGVVAADFDGDGWQEILVANDGTANHLWALRNGDLEETGLFAGVAVNRSGRPEASMGIALADYDGDGDEDIFLTHLAGETNTLLSGDGAGNFSDDTRSSGLGPDGFAYTAFGTGSLDVDGDGALDLIVMNGAVRVDAESGLAGQTGLGQPNRVYRGLGDGSFVPFAGVDAVLDEREISRGLALGDLDNDGDLDVVYTNNEGPARLLQARSNPQSWWGVDLRVGGRAALGARLGFVATGGKKTVWRRVHSDGSYASSGDPRVAVTSAELGGALSELVVLIPGRPDSRVPVSELAAGRYTVLEPKTQ
jgi:hypothetical protein